MLQIEHGLGSPAKPPHAAEGIKVNSTLEELILNGNAIGDDGARQLMAALKLNNSLEYLGLQVRMGVGGAGCSSCSRLLSPHLKGVRPRGGRARIWMWRLPAHQPAPLLR